ncbi:MAG TPA: sigma-70 family RNA polymerase sigma factor [Chloroflexia bacterium]|nr:sigma-70 family RNA polymerase sigma factor [Chloroflexia bacterium]
MITHTATATTEIEEPVDEKEIIARAQAGDRHAFRLLVERYAEVSSRTARVLLRNPTDAEDAAQEAWLDAWRALPRFESGRPFRPWFVTLVVNRCRMKARRHNPEVELHEAMLDDASQEATAGTEYDGELQEALQSLEPGQRQVLALRYYADLQLEEIAATMDLPLGTVKSRLHRGLERLRERFEKAEQETRPGVE